MASGPFVQVDKDILISAMILPLNPTVASYALCLCVLVWFRSALGIFCIFHPCRPVEQTLNPFFKVGIVSLQIGLQIGHICKPELHSDQPIHVVPVCVCERERERERESVCV